MPSIRERAIKDSRRYSQSSFCLELELESTTDPSHKVSVIGKGQDTNIQFRTDGQDMVSRLVHIAFHESLVYDNNPLYPLRNSKGRLILYTIQWCLLIIEV